MAFDAGAIVGRMELALDGWKKSVETVKADQQSMTGFALRHSEEISKLGKEFAIAGAAITGALTAIVLKTVESEHEFEHMSEKTGMSTEELSRLSLTAQKGGTDIGSMVMGLKFLAAQMVTTAGATDKQSTVLGAMGISATDANGKLRPFSDILPEIANRFAGMEDGAVKVRLAVALFGRAGMDMIPTLNLGSAGFKENAELASRFGTVVSEKAAKAAAEFKDKMIDLGASSTGVTRALGEALMPAAEGLIIKLTDTVVKIKDWIKENPALVSSVLNFAGALGIGLTAGGTFLIVVANIAKALAILKIQASIPIMITVGVIGGLALKEAFDVVMDFLNDSTYSKLPEHAKAVANTKADWEKLIGTLGEYPTVIKSIEAGLKAQGVTAIESGKINEKLIDIWKSYGYDSRAAMQAVLNGDAGPAVKKLLEDLMKAHGGAALAVAGHVEKSKELSSETKNSNDEIKKLTDDALKKLEEALKPAGQATKTAAEALADLAKNTEATYPATDKLTTALLAAAASGKLTADDMKPAQDRLIELADAMNGHVSPASAKLVEDLKRQRIETAAVAKGIEEFQKDLEDLKEPYGKATSDGLDRVFALEKEKSSTDWLAGATSDLQRAYNEFNAGHMLTQLDALRIATDQLWKEAQAKGKPVMWMPDPEDVAKRAKEILTAQQTGTKALAADWGKVNEQIQADFIRSVGSIITGQTTLAEGFKSLLSSITNVFISGFGNLVKIGQDADKSLGDSATDALNGITSTTTGTLSLIGAAFSFAQAGMAAYYKQMAELDKKALEGATNSVQQAYAFLGKISDELAKKMFDFSVNNSLAATEAKYLGDMMKETGITAENFDIYLSKATNTLTLYEQGALTAADATKLADDQFGQLLEAAKKLGTEGSEAMINFIKTARADGLELASINAYVIENLNKIPAALTTMIAASDNSADSLKGLGQIALTTFEGMVAAGVPYYDAITAMADPLAALAKKYEDLGLAADPALAELMKIVGVTKEHKELFDAISANDTILKALSNSGYLTADTMKTLTKNAVDYHAQLIANGMTEDQALHAMKGSLQDIYDASVANGIPLDENTQRLVDQAKAAGLVKDKVDMGDVANKTLTVLEKIAAMFEKMFGFADSTKGVLESINGQTYGYNMAENWSTNNPGDGGGGGGGGGGTCFVEGVPVTMADGSKRPGEQVRVGDPVRAYDTETREFLTDYVDAVIAHEPGEVKQLVWINGIGVTPEHPFWINGVWKQVGDARVGDHLISDSGWVVDVATKTWGPGGVKVWNLTLRNKTHDYFAGGVLVHNIQQKPEYALGGFVPFTGPAMLHAGEYVNTPQEVAAMTRGGAGGGSGAGGGVTVNLNGPLISTSGVSESDLRRAGETLFDIVEGEANRLGMRLARA
jgi:hypothetical protein